MAKNKVGLSYYNVDTDRYQDIKIKRLKKDFGCNGLAVYDYILCEIYRVKGCFLVWDESTAFDVADYLGLKETLVNEIVSYCGVVGLFDKALLTRERVLTSLAIQSRYKDFCVRAKRSKIEIPEKYEILLEECSIIPEESEKPREVCPEVKRREVKRSKENDDEVSILPEGAALSSTEGYSPSSSIDLESIYSLISDPKSLEKPWLMSVANLHHLEFTDLVDYIITFFRHLKAEGVTAKSLKDFKKHFNSWLRIQLDLAKRTPGNSSEWEKIIQEAKHKITQ